MQVTVTHVVGKAVAHAIADHPELNTRLFRSRFIPQESVDIFFIVSVDEGRDLSGVKVATPIASPWSRSRRSSPAVPPAFAAATTPSSGRAKACSTPRRPGCSSRSCVPAPGSRPTGTSTSSDSGCRGRRSAARWSAPSGCSGSSMPTARCRPVPDSVARARRRDRPKAVVVDGEVVARPMLTVSATIDHRYLDGSHAARLVEEVRTYLEDPARSSRSRGGVTLARRGVP